jgi:hypothetical protein
VAWQDLARVAGLVNQLATAANSGKILPAKDVLPRLDEIAEAVRLLRMALVAGGDQGEADK